MPKIVTPSEFLDLITGELITDPVLGRDTHTYQRNTIEMRLEENQISPKTKFPMSRDLVFNDFAQTTIKKFLKENKICTQQEFSDALQKGDLKEIEALNFLDIYVNAKDKNACTPLYMAVERKQLEVTRFLLINGASVDACNTEHEYTALHKAALKNLEELIILLRAFNAKPNEKSRNKMTPLHLAALNGNINAIPSLLVNNHAALSMPGQNGLTPLECAKNRGSEVAIFLLENAAKVAAAFKSQSFSKENWFKFQPQEEKSISELTVIVSDQKIQIERLQAVHKQKIEQLEKAQNQNRLLKEEIESLKKEKKPDTKEQRAITFPSEVAFFPEKPTAPVKSTTTAPKNKEVSKETKDLSR